MTEHPRSCALVAWARSVLSTRPMNRTLLLALALSLASCAAEDGDDDTDTTAEHDLDLCQQAEDRVLEAGCGSSDDYCADHVALYERAGCLEEDIAWYECIINWSGDVCEHSCDYETPLACLETYCTANPADPDCSTPPPAP
jgi:hypothetical protein